MTCRTCWFGVGRVLNSFILALRGTKNTCRSIAPPPNRSSFLQMLSARAVICLTHMAPSYSRIARTLKAPTSCGRASLYFAKRLLFRCLLSNCVSESESVFFLSLLRSTTNLDFNAGNRSFQEGMRGNRRRSRSQRRIRHGGDCLVCRLKKIFCTGRTWPLYNFSSVSR